MKSHIINVEKDLHSKVFKKDPFGDKWKVFLRSDVIKSSGNGTNPDGIGMNLQLRSEMIKAQIQSLLGEAKQATSKFLLPAAANVKKKTSMKKLDHSEDIDFQIEDTIVNPRARLVTLVDSKMVDIANLYSGGDFTTAESNWSSSKLSQMITDSVASHMMHDLFLDHDISNLLLAKRNLNHSISPQRLEREDDSLLEAEHPLRHMSSTSKPEDNHLSKYLKFILPFSFSNEDFSLTLLEESDDAVMEEWDTDQSSRAGNHATAIESCYPTNLWNSDDDNYDVACTMDCDAERDSPTPLQQKNEIEYAKKPLPTSERNAAIRAECATSKKRAFSMEEDDFVDDIANDSMCDSSSTSKSAHSSPAMKKPKKRKNKVSKGNNEVKLRLCRKDKRDSSIDYGQAPTSGFIAEPSLSLIQRHRKKHCDLLQKLICNNATARKKLEEIAVKRREVDWLLSSRHRSRAMKGRSDESDRDNSMAMKILLPLPSRCPPPTSLTVQQSNDRIDPSANVQLLPDEAYDMPYSLTMLDLNQVS